MFNIEEATAELGKLIIEKQALKFGDFTLASGKKSDYYIDGRLITLRPEGARLIGDIMLSIIREKFWESDAVGGMAVGSVPIATAVSIASALDGKKPLDAFFVRKETKSHGTKKLVEGPVKKGTRVVMLEDVMTTGGSTATAIEHAEEAGLIVMGIIAIIDREEEKVKRLSGYPYVSLLRISELREMKDKG